MVSDVISILLIIGVTCFGVSIAYSIADRRARERFDRQVAEILNDPPNNDVY